MKTSIIEKFIFFETSIAKIGVVSELFRSKSLLFITELEKWLSDNEDGLKQFRMSESSYFSILRNRIGSAKAKDVPKKKRYQFEISAECLEEAHEILTKLHDPIKNRIQQGRETIQQILVLIEGTPKYLKADEESFDKHIKTIWSKLKKDQQFASITLQLKASLPEVDILRILAEEVEC